MSDAFGVDVDLGPYSGRINPDYHTHDFLKAVGDCAALLRHPSCRILDESRNRIGVASFSLDEERVVEVVIKEFRTEGVDKLKSLFQASKARRAWRGSLALVKAGLGTPLPIGYLEKKKGLFLEQSYFLNEYIADVTEIRVLFRELSSDALDQLLEELAAYLSRCSEAGINHRDLSDGNILVSKNHDGHNQFFLLDTNRIHCTKKNSILRSLKNLIRLGIPDHHQKSFLALYLQRPAVSGWLWTWYRLNKGVYTNYVALKRTLGLRKIAQKLKIQ
jgi:serine/threonine protein kinase